MNPRRFRSIAWIALAAILVAPLAARAGEVDASGFLLGWRDVTARLGFHAIALAARSEGWRLPAVRGARASSRELGGLKLWASAAGYSVGRRGAGYGLGGGAALPLDIGIALTAGYRLMGYAAGAPIGTAVDDVQDRIGTPYLGFELEF